MHNFNDSVLYVRNGKPIPAIVLSSLQSEHGELLTLLYAQPEIGPTLLAQGTTRGVAQVQLSVLPFVEGNAFGWKEDDYSQAVIANDAAVAELLKVSGELQKANDEVQRLQEELAQTTEGRDKALQDMANLGIKHPTAPEQLDEVQGSVEPGDPDSPAAIEMPKKKK